MIGIRKTTTQPLSSLNFMTMTIPSKCLICIFFLVSSLDWVLYDHRPSISCQALSSSSSTSTFATPTTKLTSVGRSQFAVLDGAEWSSVKSILREQQRQTTQSSPSTSDPLSTKYGYMSVVTGRDEDNRRIVAMQCIDSDGSQQASSFVYEDSVAVIPNQVSDADAISTYIASVSAIHCALPRLENIGGGGNESSTAIITGKVVVLGSGDLACFSAEGLASLGMEVFMVNNKGDANVRKNVGKLRVIKPAIGESELGFASHLGEFDSLVDTIGNERTSSVSSSFDDDGVMSAGESTLQMLKSRHKCYNYVSTLTHSQNIVGSEGLFGGPRKAEGYSEKVGDPAFLRKSHESQSIFPPRDIGSTLETLMKNNVILTEKQRSKACSKKSDAIRGWSLSDFWEQISWPRDSSGSGATRFGLPVREDPFEIEEEDEFLYSKALYDGLDDDFDDIDDFDLLSSSNPKDRANQSNPFVSNIMDIDGFQSDIVDTEKNCIVFMSAKFCRTCKTINPAYTRMARINQENENGSNYSFVKAETSGASGKELAKHVSVRAVPSFVFVREGKILGQTYVSKLPSPKVDKAMQLLASGADWDYSILDDGE